MTKSDFEAARIEAADRRQAFEQLMQETLDDIRQRLSNQPISEQET